MKEVITINSSDIKVYVIDMQTIQKKIRDIYENGDHYE